MAKSQGMPFSGAYSRCVTSKWVRRAREREHGIRCRGAKLVFECIEELFRDYNGIQSISTHASIPSTDIFYVGLDEPQPLVPKPYLRGNSAPVRVEAQCSRARWHTVPKAG